MIKHKKCAHNPAPSDAFCMQCGQKNPRFSRAAYRRVHNRTYNEAELKARCAEAHRAIFAARKDFPRYMFCELCGKNCQTLKVTA